MGQLIDILIQINLLGDIEAGEFLSDLTNILGQHQSGIPRSSSLLLRLAPVPASIKVCDEKKISSIIKMA
ncbi:MAG: hypothetical protein ACRD47_09735 [Nitrososphaeraceae archaeon]